MLADSVLGSPLSRSSAGVGNSMRQLFIEQGPASAKSGAAASATCRMEAVLASSSMRAASRIADEVISASERAYSCLEGAMQADRAAVAPAVCCPQPAGAPPAEPIVVSRTRAAEPRAPEERPLCGVGRLEGRRCALRQPAAAGCGCCRLHLCWSSCAASTAMRQQCATETRCRCKCCAAGGQRTRRLRPLVQIQTAGWRRQWIAGNVAVDRRASPTCGA
jgi:hypothetical protein